MIDKMMLWDDFCKDHQVLQQGVLLFELKEGLSVDVKRDYGRKNKRRVLNRSNDMNKKVEEVVNEVKNNDEYEGVIYMMYWEEGNRVKPLYIGKSEKLSANMTTDGSKFCRWGYDESRHIGGLSAAFFQDRKPKGKSINYKKWAETLFKNKITTNNCELIKLTYFWISAWKRSEGPWKEFGLTSLNFLECLLIGIASEIEEFADTLLNVSGVNRREE